MMCVVTEAPRVATEAVVLMAPWLQRLASSWGIKKLVAFRVNIGWPTGSKEHCPGPLLAENNKGYLGDLFCTEERVEVKDDLLKEDVDAVVL